MDKQQACIVVAVIKNADGEILVARRHQPDIPATHGMWEFVGGGVEWGEDPEAALLREVKEEAGLDVIIKRLLPKVFHDTLSQLHVIILTYECEVKGSQQPTPSDPEIAEIKFVAAGELSGYRTFKNVKEALSLINSNA